MNPLLFDFPSEFYTERLFIRMPKPGDGKAVYDAIQASMKELKPWMIFAQKEQTEEEVEVSIRKSHIQFLQREDLRLLVFSKETGEFIASAGLHRINWDIPQFEIGYWIDSRFSGKGYMVEAAKGITDYAFSELKANRVEIRCDSLNKKSRAIPEKLGFKLEGTLESASVAVDGNGLRDMCVFAMTRYTYEKEEL
ncbi:GNAT family N-acetyltransferase [Bacillus sp. GX]|uniref:Acetyltransferase n=1 Tax=Bacillus albus TaxID=2026189 RepID=A0A1J9UQN7_9BACI|nr:MULTISPECIES: GNAT family N-acetyltransferase [Bacillus]AZQ48042.1 N-acetyltransferase [Bacillus albus]MBU5215661.1 GNAT family N-acetyltransferase [Bacillus albus]MDA2026434.1 GNAT family N-acetyltransferase [Bacillus cereus group sp. Bcc03]MDA2216767.1 GNAT family N-acetyltransferase [Bacillus cereus group sp. Bc228]MDA2228328.1 GNAT family N-acetyltransferase [Bacillus cereus group sp. Bc227]